MADSTDEDWGAPSGETAQASVAPVASSRETDALELPTIEPTCYRVGEEAGRGAIGRVWRARDRRLGRPVAIKELLELRGSGEARFVREALVTARLQHPGVVPVYEAGRWPTGEPFYAMKFVDGRSLHDAVAACRTLNERMALVPNVLAVAETIAYAHDQGVVHRDLKPANVVVGEFGETVVIDWGLAKDRELAESLDGDEATDLYEITHAQMTRVGAVVGTPAYMPPEQASGEPVDERADVYAVGAMLYHVLAARPPFEGASDKVLAQVLAGPPPSLASRVDGLPRDLLAIVDKAMARSAGERYANGKELAQDLSRFLTGQLVGAREYSRLTLIGRWLRKHRLIVGAVSVLLTALAVTAIFSARRIVRERNVAQARSAQLVLSQAKAVIDADPTAALAWLKQYPDFGTDWRAVQQIGSDAFSRGVARHTWLGEPSTAYPGAMSSSGGMVATLGLGGVRLWDTKTGRLVKLLPTASFATSVTFSPDDKTLWVGTDHGELMAFDLRHPDGGPRSVHAHEGWTKFILCSPDGRDLVTSGSDLKIRSWHVNPADGSFVPAESWGGHSARIDAVFRDSAGRIWSSSLDGTVRRWQSGATEPETIFDGKSPRDDAPMAISADGKTMATAAGQRVFLWKDGRIRELGQHRASVKALLIRGEDVISGGADDAIVIWRADGTFEEFKGHQSEVMQLAISPDAKTLASSDATGEIRLWGASKRVLRGHSRQVRLAFSPDGTRLLSDGTDGVARLWDTASLGYANRLSPQAIFGIAFAADSKTLFTTGRDGHVRTLNLATGEPQDLGQHGQQAYDQDSFADGRRFASGGWDGSVMVWNIDGSPPQTWKHGSKVWGVDVAPDDRRVASADADGTVLVHDLTTGANVIEMKLEDEARRVLFSPDGSLLAAGGTAGKIHVKTLATGQEVVLSGHTDGISGLIFSADSRTLYSASWDGTLRIWDLATRTSRVLTGHTQRVRTMALSPDGKMLASGSLDRTIRLWDVTTGTSKELKGHTAEARHVVFSPDGKWIASAGWDDTVRLWNVSDGRSLVLRGHSEVVHRVAFSPDGKTLASASEDGTVGLWNLADVDAVPATRDELRKWLAATTTAEIGPDETLATRP
jgi:WD40 repeat protein/tRNA A-37 threonylcarbamoyl transferase component Bud32